MAGNVSTLTFAGDATALQRAAKQAQQATTGVAQNVKESSDQMRAAGQRAQTYGERLGNLGATADGLSSAFGEAGGSLQTLIDFQQRGAVRAAAHARSLAAVEQAGLDASQAQRDLSQSVLDFGQSVTDGKRASLEIEKAQRDYTEAVKEFGPGSIEAREALLDIEDAQHAVKQAAEDGKQATEDGSQAMRSGKDAALDMADAQRELASTEGLGGLAAEVQSYASVASAATGTVLLLAMAYNAVNVAALRSAAGQAVSRVATLAGAAASAVATAAQWLWNVAMTANPIGLIIVAIGALVAAIVWIATQTTWFQDLWDGIWGKIGDPVKAAWDWIQDSAGAVWAYLTGLPGKLGSAFSAVRGFITAPFRAAFNFVADAWNNTIGRLSWTVPGWVPGIGGSNISAPRLPKFHAGGVIPGAPGEEVLAVLQAGETVLPSGASAPVIIEIKADGSRASEILLYLIRDAIEVRGGTASVVEAAV
jgi:hypothetical protein